MYINTLITMFIEIRNYHIIYLLYNKQIIQMI